jgi:hypothetical protein
MTLRKKPGRADWNVRVTLDHRDDVQGRDGLGDREVAGERTTSVGRDLVMQRALVFGPKRCSSGGVILWDKRLLFPCVRE